MTVRDERAAEVGEVGWAVTHDDCTCGHRRADHTFGGRRDACIEDCDCPRYVRWLGGGD